MPSPQCWWYGVVGVMGGTKHSKEDKITSTYIEQKSIQVDVICYKRLMYVSCHTEQPSIAISVPQFQYKTVQLCLLLVLPPVASWQIAYNNINQTVAEVSSCRVIALTVDLGHGTVKHI